MKNRKLAGSKPAPGAPQTRAAIFIALLCCSPAQAADPYTSKGFLEFPKDIEVGLMSAVAIDSSDNIYVLHRGEPPVVAFDANGKFVRAWGQGLFKVPHGLRVDRAGNIWTTDNGNHVLRRFNREGRLLETLGTEGKAGGGKDGFRAPDDLVFDSQGLSSTVGSEAWNSRDLKSRPH